MDKFPIFTFLSGVHLNKSKGCPTSTQPIILGEVTHPHIYMSEIHIRINKNMRSIPSQKLPWRFSPQTHLADSPTIRQTAFSSHGFGTHGLLAEMKVQVYMSSSALYKQTLLLPTPLPFRRGAVVKGVEHISTHLLVNI